MGPIREHSPPTPADTDAAELARRWRRLLDRIDRAAEASGRAAGAVQLLAVSKSVEAQRVAQAAALGQMRFGENYAQEALAKIDAVAALGTPGPLEWHFIGPIQSNKTRRIAESFDWVQSVDRIAIAQRLGAQRPAALPPLQVLVEVNVSGEASKGGIAPEELAPFAAALAGMPQLCLRGIMAIPAPEADPAAQRAVFARLRRMFEDLRARFPASPPAAAGGAPGACIDTLSMGMSGDFEAAISEGATLVRIGTALFGERQ